MSALSLAHSLMTSLNKLVTPGLKKRTAYRLFNVELKQRIPLSPSMTRLVFTGPDVQEMNTLAADQRIKLFFPSPDGSASDLPDYDWHAARRALPVEKRPAMRTYTIRQLRAEQAEVDVDFVLHGVNGPASAWATQARVGDRLQLVAPDRNYAGSTGGYEWQPPEGMRQVLLIGDETALPAIAGILEQLADQPDPPEVQAFIEVPHEADCLPLRCGPTTKLHWLPRDLLRQHHGEGMLHAVRELAKLPAATVGSKKNKALENVDIERDILWERASQANGEFYVWVAGESAAVISIRRHLINERGLDRRAITLMGYWRLGRSLE